MNAYQCDRCHNFFMSPPPTNSITVVKGKPIEIIEAQLSFTNLTNRRVDLCANCKQEIFELIHGWWWKE